MLHNLAFMVGTWREPVAANLKHKVVDTVTAIVGLIAQIQLAWSHVRACTTLQAGSKSSLCSCCLWFVTLWIQLRNPRSSAVAMSQASQHQV